jgi:glycosyltransferase involved in cell wall biosynthesis
LRGNVANYDAVVSHGLWQYHSFGTWRALRGGRVPYLVFPHGMLDPWFKRTYPLKHLKKWLYWPWAEYRVLRDAAAVLFTCEEERIQSARSFWLYRVNPVVVGFGIAEPEGDATSQKEAFLSRFPALRGTRMLLFLGRIHPKKGCDLLVEAFARVAARDPALRLVMAGPDSVGMGHDLRRRSERLGVAERILWPGMLSGDEKWGAFRAAEAFVLPSHQENFGVAVVEAMACGTPVLVSDKVNIWREIDADGAGLVGPDTREGSAALLERWLALSEADRSRCGKRARESFARRFHIETATHRLLATIGAACARRGT